MDDTREGYVIFTFLYLRTNLACHCYFAMFLSSELELHKKLYKNEATYYSFYAVR